MSTEFGFRPNVVIPPETPVIHVLPVYVWVSRQMPALPPGERGCVAPELTACTPLARPEAHGDPEVGGGRSCRLAFLHPFQARVGIRPLLSASPSSPPHPPFFIIMRVFKCSTFPTERKKTPAGPRWPMRPPPGLSDTLTAFSRLPPHGREVGVCMQGLSSTLLPADGVTAPTGLSSPVSPSLARHL